VVVGNHIERDANFLPEAVAAVRAATTAAVRVQ
jgi:hypothetical protein